MVEIKCRWGDTSPYKVFKPVANGNPKEIPMTYTELGELVQEFRRNQRNRQTERAVEWYIDTLIHYSARQRAWLQPEVIANMRPLAYESLWLHKDHRKVEILRNPYKYCDVASVYIDLKLLHQLWGFRRSQLYVYHLALYLGSPPDLKVQNTADGLIKKSQLPHHVKYLSYLYWQGRKEGLLPFDQTLIEFRETGIKGRSPEQIRREFAEIYDYVVFMLNCEYPIQFTER